MPPLVSIVLSNFNYEQYVSTAIESAIGQDYAHTEVIVVDDGSTDGSWDAIAGFGGRVRAVRKHNGGQASALNAGFRLSGGEIVIFLDADDFLSPSAASSVVTAWVDGCAKVQFRLAIVDQQGTRIGALPPADLVLPSGDMVPMIAAAGSYVCPVTSGNAYSRRVLELLMPIPETEFCTAADGYLNAVAPFYGDVISLQEEHGAYRMHGANVWMGRAGVEHLRTLIEHDWRKERYVLERAQRLNRAMPAEIALRDWRHVFCRLSHLRLDPQRHPAPSDTRVRLGWAGMSAIRVAPDLSGAERLFQAAIMLATALAPAPLARRLARWANTSKPRPAWLRRARRAARAVTLQTRRSGVAARR